MSPRAVPRRARFSWLAPRKCEPPAVANRYIWLVGKQSKVSNRNTSGSISFVEKWSSCIGAFPPVGFLTSPPQQGAHLGRFLCAGQIRSDELRLLKSNCNTAAVRSIHNPFSCNNLSSSVRSTFLTRRCSE